MKLSICIPTWNGLEVLKECLRSVYSQAACVDFEVLVFDNGSNDGTIEYLFCQYPSIRIFRSLSNLGFSGSVNRLILSTCGCFILILNNDAVLNKNFLCFIIKFISENNADVVCPKVINYKERDIIESAGDFINETGQAFNRTTSNFCSSLEKIEEVDLAPASASLYRKKYFIEVGLFDEDFFAYGEDVDLSLRGKKMGKRYMYFPKAVAYHRHMYTSSRIPQFREYLQFRNQTIILIKNYPLKVALRKFRLIKIIAVHLNTIIFMIIKGYAIEALLADFWIFLNIPRLIKKRLAILKSNILDDKEFEKLLIRKKIRAYGLAR